MVISSIHTRLTRTSSDLRTLSAVLLPPSPILKADGLLIFSTSAEIPILFEPTTHACDAPLPFRDPPGSWSLDEELKSIDKLDTTGNIRDSALGDDDLPKSWMCMESEKVWITTELPNNRHAKSPRTNSFPVRAVSDDPRNALHPAYYDFLGGDAGRPNTLDDRSLPILGKQCDSKGLRDPQIPCPNATAFYSTTVVPREDLDDDQPPTITTFHTYSALPTSTFASPSPSPSADVISPLSSPTSQQRHRRPLERARAVRFPGRSNSPRLQGSEAEAHLVRNAPPSPTKHAYPRWQLANSAPMASTHSCTTSTVHPLMKDVALPEELSWLKHMIIELWIDQEGFRAVRPCMQLIGYSPRTRSLYPYESAESAESDVAAGVVEFMPTKRETFAFHYATLDSPPALRMVSVAGDESRDYISRQATLSVKVNGAYTVLGTETIMASKLISDVHGSRPQNVRLRWKFDYLVSNRKVNGTGKILPGEKTLTPLTFSCSPYLFHPLRGKKAGLMHIIKKNLVLKLGSHKLEPPAYYASSHSILPRISHYRSTGRGLATHARAHSDAFPKGEHDSLARSLLDAGVGGKTIQGMDRVQRARRRRASSAGEDSLICLTNEPRHGGITIPFELKEGMFVPASPALF